MTQNYSRVYVVLFVALLALTNALSFADRQLFGVLMPAIKAEFGLSDVIMGALGGSAFTLSFVALSLPLAELADRWSRRKVLALSIMIWSAATAFCGAASSVAQMAIGRVAVGVGEAGGSPPAQSLIASIVPPRYLSAAFGLFTAGIYIGSAGGSWGGAVLESTVGWRGAFLVMAALGLPLMILIAYFAPRRSPDFRAGSRIPLGGVVRACLSLASLRLLIAGASCMNIYAYAVLVWMPSYLVRSHGLTLVEAGVWNGMSAAIGGITGSLLSGVIADRYARHDARYQLRIPALGFLIGAPLSAIQMLWPERWVIEVGGVVLPLVALLTLPGAFAISFWMAPALAAVQKLVPPAMRARATALLMVTIYLVGGIIGPIVTGLISDWLEPIFGAEALRYSLLIATTAILLGGFLMWFASSRYPSDLAARESKSDII